MLIEVVCVVFTPLMELFALGKPYLELYAL